MRLHDVLMSCGTAVSILAAAPALPQPERQPPAPDRPPTTTPQQPRTTDRQPTTTTTRPSTETSARVPKLLQDTEGVWRFDATFNPDFFKMTGSGLDRNAAATSSTQQSVSGMAETRLVLGKSVVEQRIVLPDLKGSAISQPGNIEPSRSVPSDASSAFKALSLLTFESGGRNYSCVFVDGQSGKVHHDTGTYEESSNRLVFNGFKSPSDMIKPGSGISTTPGTPGTPGTPPSGVNRDQPGMGGQDVRVVLEVLSPDSHRVTMYQGGTGSTTGISPSTPNRTDTPGQPNRNDPINPSQPPSGGRTDPTRPPSGQDPSKPDPNRPTDPAGRNDPMTGQPTTTTMKDSFGTIIYRATFTRAQGAEASRLRAILQEDQGGTSRAAGDLDR